MPAPIDTAPPHGAGPTTDPAPSDVAWHHLDAEAALEATESGPAGLDEAEAARRLDRHGPNELVEKGATGPLRLLWEQLTAVMVLILIGAAALSLVLGKFLEAGAIGAIVVLFALLGFLQEYRAEKAIAALRRMAVPNVRVVRGGQPIDLPAIDLVPGDLVVLEAGNVVPADLRLVETASLRIQESALTGESEPVDKEADALPPGDQALGDRRNLAFSGTQVTFGRGRGVVVATGMATELGRIATLLQGVASSATPLQERLDRVGKQLAVAGVIVAGLVVAMGLLAGEPISELALTAISVAVAVIPEGLPAVVTFTLAIGAQRMLRRNALIRRLPATETLGSVTVICSDKTGTLTENRMTVTMVDVAGHRHRFEGADVPEGGPASAGPTSDAEGAERAARLTLAAASLCNDGELRRSGKTEGGESTVLGDPTETALLVGADKLGVDVEGLRAAVPRIGEHPFDSERKRMTTIHGPLGSDAPEALRGLPADVPLAFVKGAPDGLVDRAVAVWDPHAGGPVPLTGDRRQQVLDTNAELAAAGMRVLAVAFRELPPDTAGPPLAGGPAEAEQTLTLLGLAGIIDPPRAEVADAVATCNRAGIRTVMITGDHPITARAIAAQLGIGADTDGTASPALTGAELDRLDDAGLDRAVRNTSVFARVSPEHKLRIVEALQRQGDVVAMTGDGVNDAPALKKADIGVAMGITGTDVSKEASDVVLRDDNFTTIVASVEEGRVIYDNLRRFVKFAVAGNIGKMAVMLGWPLPLLVAGGDLDDAVALLPLQLLWLNLMTDGLLGLSLGMEPAERTVMRRPPHTPGGSIWAGGLGMQTAWNGVLIGALALAVGFVYQAMDRSEWQTMLFTTLAFLQVFQAFGTRSTTEPLWRIGLRSNPLMLGIGALVTALQLAAVYTPLRNFLDLEPIGAADLAVAIVVGAVFLVVLELSKVLNPKAPAVAPAVTGG
ncbi:MAG: cation-translocating P-type ATPase [Acidimicrobiales bacterium]